MKKIWLVTKREYITRVKKKSFLVMTLLSPLLIVLFYGIIFYFSFNKDISDTSKKVLIVENDGATPAVFNIKYNAKWVAVSLEAGSVGTFVW